VLYAAKRAHVSGKDETKKFRYLREISDLWVKKGRSAHDKRVILEAIGYLMNLTDENYTRQTVEYLENLQMREGDREMYKSIFERVYTEQGRQEGKLEMAKDLLARGVSPDIIAASAGLSQSDMQSLMETSP
jgi:predicted transposase YdaD